MKRIFLLLILAVSCCAPKDGEYVLRILTTNDVHGRFLDSLYVEKGVRNSLTSVSWYVDSVRTAAGRENVILIDAGDILQGDNASYYYNFVDTLSKHLYSRIAEYMEYDAVVVGNHDIEAGHQVYDRVASEMDVPMLAANAIRTDGQGSYFPEYTILRRQGLKIAIVGFTNPNIPNWLAPDLWEGMVFEDLVPFAQSVVDRVVSKERPDVVIVAVHSGTGEGDGSQRENAGLDLFKTLRGVDLVICAHDHRPVVHSADSIALVNAGSRCGNIGLCSLTVKVEDGKVVSKTSVPSLIKVRRSHRDTVMSELFHPDYVKVRDFTCREIGQLKTDLRTADAYAGMSDYINLIHDLSLVASGADISFAAPLTFNGSIPAGTLLYNDLFTIYPFENQLYVLTMTGKEVKDYLEYSYDNWIYTYEKGAKHILKIVNSPDPRTGAKRWSFVGRSYNFDSAGGLVYEVDVTKPFGQRVLIKSLADGSAFDPSATYNVAMTSYRANGGGGIVRNGAGIDNPEERIVARYPEIRELLYDYIVKNGSIDPSVTGNPAVIGKWAFVPESLASRVIAEDMKLLFK